YQKLRFLIYHTAELEGAKLSGEIEMDESYFGGGRAGTQLGKHHRAPYWCSVNHSKNMVDKKTKNHINGIEGFWSFAKHVLYNYRGVSKYHCTVL
ncbi:hypothetical protein L0Y49_03640, partial [bacterium]|nr:hypothetical protein [bacterium]